MDDVLTKRGIRAGDKFTSHDVSDGKKPSTYFVWARGPGDAVELRSYAAEETTSSYWVTLGRLLEKWRLTEANVHPAATLVFSKDEVQLALGSLPTR